MIALALLGACEPTSNEDPPLVGPWTDLVSVGCASAEDERVTCWETGLVHTTADARSPSYNLGVVSEYGWAAGLSDTTCYADGSCSGFKDNCIENQSEPESTPCESEIRYGVIVPWSSIIFMLDDGTAWSSDGVGDYEVPVPAKDVSGGFGRCRIEPDDRLRCGLAEMEEAFLELGVGAARAVAAEWSLTCAVTLDGALYCVGLEFSDTRDELGGRAFPELGRVRSVVVGDWSAADGLSPGSYACGVREDGTIACWAGDERNPILEVPEGNDFRKVVNAEGTACAITHHGVVECWGACTGGACDVPEGPVE